MKKTLYPKTKRFDNSKTVITEKLDGSNLGIFKINGKLLIAQRNNCFYEDELPLKGGYKGLYEWIKENKDKIDLYEGSGVFGEWIGMGQISYSLDKRFYIFAKANISEDLEVRNINYNIENLIYPFISKVIPSVMDIVPVINHNGPVDIDNLNIQYDKYCELVGRKVEGFVINNNNDITKYIRYKDGKETEHSINSY